MGLRDSNFILKLGPLSTCMYVHMRSVLTTLWLDVKPQHPLPLPLLPSQLAMCAHPMREISNPGASGSLFYLSADDAFIIKTVQKKEAHFLQKLLPGYYLVRN